MLSYDGTEQRDLICLGELMTWPSEGTFCMGFEGCIRGHQVEQGRKGITNGENSKTKRGRYMEHRLGGQGTLPALVITPCAMFPAPDSPQPRGLPPGAQIHPWTHRRWQDAKLGQLRAEQRDEFFP